MDRPQMKLISHKSVLYQMSYAKFLAFPRPNCQVRACFGHLRISREWCLFKFSNIIRIPNTNSLAFFLGFTHEPTLPPDK